MTQTELAVAVAGLGVLAALVSALIGAGAEFRSENRRRTVERREAEMQAVRTQAADTFRHLFALQHEMEWFTWHSANRPGSVDLAMTRAYESAVHAAYPGLLGAVAVLASLDLSAYDDLMPLIERVYELEGEIGRLITGLMGRRTRADALLGLKELHQSVRLLYRDLPPRMASAMKRTTVPPTSSPPVPPLRSA